jgi:hypothetical protein
MMRSLLFLSLSALSLARAADLIKIATFDGQDKSTTWSWREVNDPVPRPARPWSARSR